MSGSRYSQRPQTARDLLCLFTTVGGSLPAFLPCTSWVSPSHLMAVISKKRKRVGLSKEGRCRSQSRKWL